MKKYILSNGMQIPMIGFGCYTQKPDGYSEVIRNAIEAGFTYFDGASVYGTERQIAKGIRESGVSRKALQLVSKAWTDEMGYRNVKEACYRSLDRLETDYLDIYMIHWPKARADEKEWKENDLETWRGMEDLYREGLIKGLGMSNFLPHHMMNILENCTIKPVIDQLEVHPGYSQEAAVRWLLDQKIHPQAHSALGSGSIIRHPAVEALVEKYQKTVPQICLRFLIQKGVMPVVKAGNTDHMRANLDIFDFEIQEEDMWLLSCMPQDAAVDDHPDFSDQTLTSDFEQ